MSEGETIKIVGHSQGAVSAAGIAFTLANYSPYGGLIEFVDYLSPHQPGGIIHPDGVRGRQFSTESHKVSSKGLLPKLFGSPVARKLREQNGECKERNMKEEEVGIVLKLGWMTWLNTGKVRALLLM